VRFTAQSGPATVLTFELNRQDPSGTSDPREVGFHVTLRRQGQPVGDGVYVMFRPQTESAASIPGRDALLEAVGPKAVEASGPSGPITALLSGLPIAPKAVFMRSPLGWAIFAVRHAVSRVHAETANEWKALLHRRSSMAAVSPARQEKSAEPTYHEARSATRAGPCRVRA